MEVGVGMNFGGWKAKLQDGWISGYAGTILFLYRDTKGGTQILTADGTVKMLKEGGSTNSNHFAVLDDDQIQALAEAFATKGIKTNNDHKNEGLLEATKYHLEDMRKLALKGKK